MKRILLIVCALLMAFVFSAAAENVKFENTEIIVRCDTEYKGELLPEGDGVFLLSTKPRRGELHLNVNGSFSYTPRPGFSGRDYFGYRVKDSKGEVSEEKTVIVRVIKPQRSSSLRRSGRRLP